MLFNKLIDNQKKYIPISTAIELLASKEGTLYKAIVVLLHLKLDKVTICWKQGEYFDFIDIDEIEDHGVYKTLRDLKFLLEELGGINCNIKNIPLDFKKKLEGYYWIKAVFMSHTKIKSNVQISKANDENMENLNVEHAISENYHKQYDHLQQENEQLKIELAQLQEQISQFEQQKINQQKTNQTNKEEFKLHPRAQNNVSKLILVLAHMAKINVYAPYATYQALSLQANLLGIDKFPSDESVANWLKKASSFKNTS